MSDDQQPEDLRPIPDGGLKDNMPGWLKRPPAWRNIPTAEQRHEQKLPEPDTSEIDPKTLVDISDLPQWLQTIAARGEVPVPQPDQTVGYALEQIQAVSARSRESAPEAVEPIADEPTPGSASTVEEPAVTDEPEKQTAVEDTIEQVVEESTDEETQPMSTLIVVGICVLILVVIAGAYFLV